mgnify:CR=1 FL=1
MILTVQPTWNGAYRLGISLYDSINTFRGIRGTSVNLIMKELNLTLKTTCGPLLNKGFDLNSSEISNWILRNNLNNYLPGNPTKLEFEYKLVGTTHILTFIQGC